MWPFWEKHCTLVSIRMEVKFLHYGKCRDLEVWKWMLHTLRNANKKQTILCLIFFSVCGQHKKIGYFCQFDIMYSELGKWFFKKNNNAFDYPAVASSSQTLCLLIILMYRLVGRVLGGMASVNVEKKKGQNKFLQRSNISYCAWCTFQSGSFKSRRSYISGLSETS